MEFKVNLGDKLRKDCKNRVEVSRFERQLAQIKSTANIIITEYISGNNYTTINTECDDLALVLKIVRNTGVPFYIKAFRQFVVIHFKTARYVDDIEE